TECEGKVTMDVRTNSILARGSNRYLEEVTKLLEVIDVASENPSAQQSPNQLQQSNRGRKPAGPIQGGSGAQGRSTNQANSNSLSIFGNRKPRPAEAGNVPSQPANSTDGTVVELQRQYEMCERQATDIARELRHFQANQPENQSRIEGEKTRLRKAVAESFAARQRLQHAEVAEFEQRMLGLRKSIELRDRIQDQIIDRRVDDLLNPDFRWNVVPQKETGVQSHPVLPPARKSLQTSSAKSKRTPDGPTTTSPGSEPERLQDVPEAEKVSAMDPELQGVWKLNDAKISDDAAKIPPEKRLRLVFWGQRHATFQGNQRTQAWHVITEQRKTAKWIQLLPIGNSEPGHGIYEVIGDGMRLSLSSDPKTIPDRFGTKHPEFIRISKTVPQELIDALPDQETPQLPPFKAKGITDVGFTNVPTDKNPPRNNEVNILPDASRKSDLIIRNAEEFRRMLDAAAAEQATIQKSCINITNTQKKTKLNIDSEQFRKLHPVEWDNLQRANRRLEIVHQELAAQIKLLQLNVQQAELILAAAQKKMERYQALQTSAAISQREVEQAMSDLHLAKVNVERAAILLNLYSKINQPDSNNATATPASTR
ncbi:MAG: hypothetical protein JWM11_599, partial [Planctomycetaceae bacterium]|nr:hypothetical protein [Planctomycetaceae bacterium]